jgi:hypothetical protein
MALKAKSNRPSEPPPIIRSETTKITKPKKKKIRVKIEELTPAPLSGQPQKHPKPIQPEDSLSTSKSSKVKAKDSKKKGNATTQEGTVEAASFMEWRSRQQQPPNHPQGIAQSEE